MMTFLSIVGVAVILVATAAVLISRKKAFWLLTIPGTLLVTLGVGWYWYRQPNWTLEERFWPKQPAEWNLPTISLPNWSTPTWAAPVLDWLAQFWTWGLIALVLVAVAAILYRLGGRIRVASGFVAAAALLVVAVLAVPILSLPSVNLPPKVQLVVASLNWWLFLPLAVLVTVFAAGYKRAAGGLAAVLALFLTFYYFAGIPACAPQDWACNAEVGRKAAAKAAEEAANAERRRLDAQEANVRRCYKDRELIHLSPGQIIRNPGDCDIGYAITHGHNTVKITDVYGTQVHPGNQTGRTSETIASIQAGNEGAILYFMLCPKNLGAPDGGWYCQKSSIFQEVTYSLVGVR